MLKHHWIMVAVLGGMLLPLQSVLNARMREFVVNPFFTTIINFSVGLIAISVVALVSVRLGQAGDLRGALAAPWWAWMGGFIGITLVSISFLAIPHIGSAVLVTAVVVGQLLAAVAIDHFGICGVQQQSLSLSRMAGVAALFAGLYLMKR